MFAKLRKYFDVEYRENKINRIIQLENLGNVTIFNIETIFYEQSKLTYPEKELMIKNILVKYHKEYRKLYKESINGK